MSNQKENGHSVVKTSDLLYVFCAAAWVNVLTTNFSDNVTFLCSVLAFMTFSIIPLEIYTSALWQQAVDIVDENPKNDAIQQSVLATIDMLRIFALSMSFILLYIPLRLLKANQQVNHSELHALDTYIFCISLFLISNWLWNQVLFRKGPDSSSQQQNYYQEIIEKYKTTVGGRASQDHFKRFAYRFTMFFEVINRILFQYCFFVVAIILIICGLASIHSDYFHEIMAIYIGWISLGIFGIQVCAKIIQIVFFSNVVSDIRAASVPVGVGATV